MQCPRCHKRLRRGKNAFGVTILRCVQAACRCWIMRDLYEDDDDGEKPEAESRVLLDGPEREREAET